MVLIYTTESFYGVIYPARTHQERLERVEALGDVIVYTYSI
jgi:hypothetical protein